MSREAKAVIGKRLRPYRYSSSSSRIRGLQIPESCLRVVVHRPNLKLIFPANGNRRIHWLG